tara:strand:+ start:560 stop:1354 length:795 start_codon:yes stop_codon:yes gene_type:complete
MAYLGRAVDSGAISNIQNLDNITFDGSSSYSLTKNSVAFVPASASNLLISIDGVVNATNFTVSGSTVDFGVAVSSSSVCNFIIHLGVGLVTSPSDNSVTTSKIQDANITTAKIADDAVTFDKMSGQNYPAFFARLSSDQSLSANTVVKIQFDTEDYDTDNNYDNSTNYRFTVSKAGIYFIYSNVVLSNSFGERAIATFKVNGTDTGRMEEFSNISGADPNLYSAFSKNLSVNDYVEVFVSAQGSGATARSQNFETYFGAYRIGD